MKRGGIRRSNRLLYDTKENLYRTVLRSNEDSPVEDVLTIY
jgi:hypothetical protein